MLPKSYQSLPFHKKVAKKAKTLYKGEAEKIDWIIRIYWNGIAAPQAKDLEEAKGNFIKAVLEMEEGPEKKAIKEAYYQIREAE